MQNKTNSNLEEIIRLLRVSSNFSSLPPLSTPPLPSSSQSSSANIINSSASLLQSLNFETTASGKTNNVRNFIN